MTNLAVMVQTIRQYGVVDMRVVRAMKQVDRQAFVPRCWSGSAGSAYEDRALPIGFGQTISQPYTVARMVELLVEGTKLHRLKGAKVLEIGTGSGWQTAILSRLFDEVYSVEIIGELAWEAKVKMQNLKIKNVEIKVGDGKLGWPDHALYQAIIVSADANEVPPALVDQLAEGGRIVVPVKGEMQRGIKVSGVMQWESFGAFSFVPLV